MEIKITDLGKLDTNRNKSTHLAISVLTSTLIIHMLSKKTLLQRQLIQRQSAKYHELCAILDTAQKVFH